MTKFYKLCRNLALIVPALLCGAQAHASEAFAEGTEIYAYAGSSPAGIYSLSTDGYELFWKDNGYSSRYFVPMNSGWYSDGKMCGYANDGWDAWYVEYDWETGAILKSETMLSDKCPIFATLNATDGKIYGYWHNRNKTELKFFIADKNNPTEITEVKTVEDTELCLGLTYNSAEGYVAGVRYDGALVKVSADGSQEVVVSTGYTLGSTVKYAALTFCAADGLYYWNPTNSEWETEMCLIDPENQTLSKVSTFPDKQFYFMLSLGEAMNPESPKAPEILSYEFVGGSADGKFVVRMPAELESGEAINGEVAWTATIDGEVAKEGTAEAGAEVTVELEGVATGSHTFAFTATVAELPGKSASTSFYVGFDTPKSPTNVTLTDTKVSWEAVTAGVNGGYVNAEAITYTVSLNGEAIGTTESTEYTLENLNQGQLRRVVATVTATANEMTSAPGESNGITVGSLSLPAYFKPTSEDFGFCQMIDGDGNGRGWSYSETYEAFTASFNLDTQVDDWLILPAIDLEKGKSISLSLQARVKSAYYPDEALEVRAAMLPTAEALAEGTTVLEKTRLTSNYEDLTGNFTATETGKWYIALHAVSDADQSGMYVKDILIAEYGVTVDSPAEVTALEAEAAGDAKLEATVTFNMPTKTVGGTELDPATVIEATVKAASEVKVSGAPGEPISAVVTTVQGSNRIEVETAIGELPGLKAYVEVYTGYDIPAAVTDVVAAISEDMKSAEISWTAPEDGLLGGIIDPAALTYTVYRSVSSSLGNYWEPLEENIEGTTFTFTPDATAQDAYTLGVAAANVAGVNPNPVTVVAVLGTPHNLPMVETFDADRTYYTYNYWVTYTPTEDYATQWGVLPVEVLPFLDTTEWNVVLCGMGLHNGALGRCGFPVFSTKGHEGVRLTAPFWTGDMATPELHVTGMAYGMAEPVEVGTVTSNGGWNELSFELPDVLLDREWVSLFLEASFPEGTSQWVCMDGYTISPFSGVSEIDAEAREISVRTLADAIEISAEAGCAYTVFTADGRVIATGTTVAGTTTVSVAPGFYLTRVADRTFHLTVK